MTAYTGTRYTNTTTAAEGRTRTAAKNNRKGMSKEKRTTVILAALLLLVFVFMPIGASSQLSSMQAKNNKIQSENEYLQAEINSMQSEIVQVANVTEIERTATKKYGMVYPSESNCITISNDKPTEDNLASTIRDEAYN